MTVDGNMARINFALDDKIRIIEELNTRLTHAQVCGKYELSSSTLSTFKRQMILDNFCFYIGAGNLLIKLE